MSRERLTLERIRGYACPMDRNQAFYWDTDAPHLALRVTRNGAKSFAFESRIGGQPPSA